MSWRATFGLRAVSLTPMAYTVRSHCKQLLWNKQQMKKMKEMISDPTIRPFMWYCKKIHSQLDVKPHREDTVFSLLHKRTQAAAGSAAQRTNQISLFADLLHTCESQRTPLGASAFHRVSLLYQRQVIIMWCCNAHLVSTWTEIFFVCVCIQKICVHAEIM